LNKKAVVAKFATTATDGKVYQVDYHNLDLIISVGYRVNSKRGTQFRIWATNPPSCLTDNTLVALTLLIAESRAEEKDAMVKVIVNLINQNN